MFLLIFTRFLCFVCNSSFGDHVFLTTFWECDLTLLFSYLSARLSSFLTSWPMTDQLSISNGLGNWQLVDHLGRIHTTKKKLKLFFCKSMRWPAHFEAFGNFTIDPGYGSAQNSCFRIVFAKSLYFPPSTTWCVCLKKSFKVGMNYGGSWVRKGTSIRYIGISAKWAGYPNN